MNYQDKIYQLLIKCNKNVDTPDLHSFTANVKNGTVFVDCRWCEVYMEVSGFSFTQFFHDDGTFKDCSGKIKSKWTGPILAATNRLEKLGIDLSTVEI